MAQAGDDGRGPGLAVEAAMTAEAGMTAEARGRGGGWDDARGPTVEPQTFLEFCLLNFFLRLVNCEIAFSKFCFCVKVLRFIAFRVRT